MAETYRHHQSTRQSNWLCDVQYSGTHRGSGALSVESSCRHCGPQRCGNHADRGPTTDTAAEFFPPRGRHASSRRHARLPKPRMQLLATRDATSGFLTVMVTRCWHDWISLPVPKPVMTGRGWVRCGPSPTPPFPDPTKQSPQRADCVTLVARVGVDHLRRDLGRRAGGGGEPLVHRGMDSPTLRSKSRARHRGARGRIKCGGRMVDGVWLPRWWRC